MQANKQVIKQTILDYFPTAVILLFGSRSRTDFTVDSDFDLLVIINEEISVKQKREYKAKIRRVLAQKKIPIDILIQSKSEIKIKKNITGHIVKQALNEGVKI